MEQSLASFALLDKRNSFFHISNKDFIKYNMKYSVSFSCVCANRIYVQSVSGSHGKRFCLKRKINNWNYFYARVFMPSLLQNLPQRSRNLKSVMDLMKVSHMVRSSRLQQSIKWINMYRMQRKMAARC